MAYYKTWPTLNGSAEYRPRGDSHGLQINKAVLIYFLKFSKYCNKMRKEGVSKETFDGNFLALASTSKIEVSSIQ